MRLLLFFSLILYAIVLPAFGELTTQDLDKIRLIVKEEIESETNPMRIEMASIKTEIATIKVEIAAIKTDVADLKTEVASLKTDVGTLKENMAGLSGRIESIEKIITWLMALILVAVGVPQIVVAWRSRKDREQERKLEQLSQEIEMLKQQIANP